MSNTNHYAIPKDDKVYWSPETTLGTAVDAAATDAIRVLPGGKLNYDQARDPDLDANGIRGITGTTAGRKTASWSLPGYLRVPSAGRQVPDIDPILKTFFQAAVLSTGAFDTTVSGAASTTTKIDVASAALYSAGGAVVINNQIRLITAVDTVATPDNITVSPALSAAPTNTTPVYGAQAYGMTLRPSGSGTIHVRGRKSAYSLKGCSAGKLMIEGAGNDKAKITLEGPAKDLNYYCFSTQLSAGVDDSTATFPVDQGYHGQTGAGTYWQIDNEVVLLVSVSANNWTVTRAQKSSSAAVHADNSEIYPYAPAQTVVGSTIGGISGSVVIGGTVYKLNSWKVSADNKIVEDNEGYGSDSLVDWDAGDFEGTLEMTILVERANFRHVVDAIEKTSRDALIQVGTTYPAIAGIALPKIEAKPQGMDVFGEGTYTTLTITAPILMTSGNDGIYLLYA